MYAVVHQLTPEPEIREACEDLLKQMAKVFEGADGPKRNSQERSWQ
jgi:hypothetical protein